MKTLLVSAAGLLLAATAPAHATNFMGDQMKASWRLPTETASFAFAMSPSKSFTVSTGPEGEVQLTTISFLVDFSADTLTFTFLSNANFAVHAFNGIYFEQLAGDAFGAIESVSGIEVNRLHNMGSAFSVNFAGQRYAAGSKIAIRFVPDVPEPASWAMMIGGFALAGGAMRARRTLPALS